MKTTYTKPATTINGQADQLIERGLIVTDRERLLRELRTIGYYRLSAYWLPFEQPPPNGQTRSKRFVDNTRHEDIIDLYIFDRKLRLLIMEAVERIEIAVRASWTNRLSLASGPHAHIDARNFRDTLEHAALLTQLASAVDRSKDVLVEHYRTNYQLPRLPPLWAVTEVMTMGALTEWVAMTASHAVKRQVAIDLGLPTEAVLNSVLPVLRYVRNICAHHGRLWNRRLVVKMMKIKRFKAELTVGPSGELDDRLYNFIVVCLHILRVQSPQTSFAGRLAALMDSISDGQRAAMGFPADWRARPIWQPIPQAPNP
jgi:abortive infection bacteriophage resistance protein